MIISHYFQVRLPIVYCQYSSICDFFKNFHGVLYCVVVKVCSHIEAETWLKAKWRLNVSVYTCKLEHIFRTIFPRNNGIWALSRRSFPFRCPSLFSSLILLIDCDDTHTVKRWKSKPYTQGVVFEWDRSGKAVFNFCVVWEVVELDVEWSKVYLIVKIKSAN